MTLTSTGSVSSGFRFVPKLDVPAFNNMELLSRLEGFAGNGDYVVLPTSGINNFYYYDAAGVLQWQKGYADVNAACDQWCGFTMVGSSLYVCAVDTAASPATYYVASFSSAGTKSDIGNDTPASDFSTVPAWSTLGAGFTYDEETTRFHLFSAGEYGVIDNVAGTFTVDPASVADHSIATNVTPVYHCGADVFCGPFDLVSSEWAFTNLCSSDGRNIDVAMLPEGIGAHQDECWPVYWKGYTALVRHQAVAIQNGARFFNRGEFNAKMIELANRVGVA